MPVTASKLLVLAAVICFALGFFGYAIHGHSLLDAGLFFGFASFLIP